MSVNQSSQKFLWWTPHHDHQHQPRMNFNSNQPHDGEDDRASPGRAEENGNSNFQQEKLEVMFEKTLTPSDVGKLNRLVIPKQHAERHFPLSNNSSGDDACGMMLSFEDEDGKFWRFRYSYWNSSQSYVLTKGWSRYVKAKQLEAGDIVLFDRHSTDPDRLFIGWRRRHDPSQMMNQSNTKSAVAAACLPAFGGGGLYPPYQYRPDPEASAQAGVNQRRTTSFSSSRTLRLFGVNMEYQFESDQSEPATPDGSSTSSPSGHIVYQNYNTQFSPRAPSYGMSNNIVQQHASGSHGQHRR